MSRVLVTGGSGGIGAALVRGLRRDGHEVTFTFCRNDEAAGVIAEATGATAVRFDQAAPTSLAELTGVLRGGDFDALVNNAAGPFPRVALGKIGADRLLAYQNAAVRSTLELSTAFVTRAKERGAGGAIVNVLSVVTMGLPPPRMGAYVVAKHALLGLTWSMAVEFVRAGVRVNAVSPGMTDTEFNADLPQRFVDEYAATLPMRRLATTEEVAAVIQFLISPAASYITGANIPVAGGSVC